MNLLLTFLLVALLFSAAALALALGLRQYSQVNHRRIRSARALLRAFAMGVQLALCLPSEWSRRFRYRGAMPYFANGAEIGAGTHENATTKYTSVAISERHLLYKFDTADATGKKIVVCGAQDRAVFVVPDEASATDIANQSPAPVEAIMLGVTNNSIRMVAAGALNPGDVIYPAAAGRVNTYVGLGSTGTNYPVGVVLVGATAAGGIVEVAHVLEVQSAAV